ncbi:MAG: ATP-dependent DNA helicase Rep [Saprospiraceae bacterium]|jgi:ATP-dependent DNA helicase Rep
MNGMNQQQDVACKHLGSPLLVLAGAGSGKTRVITQKIAWLITKRAVSPSQIVAVTFTNKAAREMKQRIGKLLKDKSETKGLTVSTFHSLGLKLLRAEAQAVGLRDGFSLLDPKDAIGLVGELMRGDLSGDTSVYEKIHGQISAWKNAGISADKLRVSGTSPIINSAIRVYPKYESYLLSCNCVDLDDLILKPSALLHSNDEVRLRWQSTFRYILVDEYQDTNGAQYEFVKSLAGSGDGLTVVGDDDQSIYGWRGALPENIGQLQIDYPQLKVVKLEQNYRSMGRILKTANALIQHNQRPYEKNLWCELGYGDAIEVMSGRDENHEAERVVSAVLGLQFEHNAKFSDFAILYRSNHQARVFEQKLREMRIPYYISGGLSFFDRAEIRDMLAYLRLITNPSDDRAFLRVINTPRRGIGPGSIEKLATFASKKGLSLFDAVFDSEVSQILSAKRAKSMRSFCQRMVEWGSDAELGDPVALFESVLEEVGYESWLDESGDLELAARRWKNVRELVDWMNKLRQNAAQGAGLGDLVSQLILRDILDKQEENSEFDQLSMMTLHAAKGLEFNYVFIVGVEEDILPHRVSVEEGSVQEERRLLYVGITRAMRALSLSYALKRRRFGETIECLPSRFLKELPQAELNWDNAEKPTAEQQQDSGRKHLANLRSLLKTD